MRDLKISIELASAVLGKEVIKCSLINKSRNSINITYFEYKEDFNPICREWNIYEFIYKDCMDWAFNKGYNIAVVEDVKVKKFGVLADSFLRGFEISEDIEKQKTREESIIKACNWILEQNK